MLGPKIFLVQHIFYQYFFDTIFLGPELCYDPELGPKKLGPINFLIPLYLWSQYLTKNINVIEPMHFGTSIF